MGLVIKMESIEGKTALVTGSSRGIGRATAIELAKRGANIVVNYAHDDNGAEETARAVEKLGQKAVVVKADVSKKSEVKQLFQEALNEFKEIHLLVNNAGVFPTAPGTPTHELSEEEIEKIIAVNLKGAIYCTQEALRHWLDKKIGGRLVNLCSVAAFTGSVSGSHYSAAKSALIGFTRSIAAQYGKNGIIANCVAPGPVRTELLKDLSPERMKAFVEGTPLGRTAEPEEIADAIAFLLAHGFVNGQTLVVDGGRVKN